MSNQEKLPQEINGWLIWQVIFPIAYVPLLFLIYLLTKQPLKVTLNFIFSSGEVILLSAVIIFNFIIELSRRKSKFSKSLFQFFGIFFIASYIVIKCLYVFRPQDYPEYNITWFSEACLIFTVLVCIGGFCAVLNDDTTDIIKDELAKVKGEYRI